MVVLKDNLMVGWMGLRIAFWMVEKEVVEKVATKVALMADMKASLLAIGSVAVTVEKLVHVKVDMTASSAVDLMAV